MDNLPKPHEYTHLIQDYNDQVKQIGQIKQHLDGIYAKIYWRVDEIISIIFEAFEMERPKKNAFSWHDRDHDDHYKIDGEIGYWFDRLPTGMDRKLFDTDGWMYSQGIPTKFLSMNNEDILGYIREDIREDRRKRNEKDLEQRLKQQSESEKKKAVLNKLTDEEKKILGIG
jgi:hypothetical protein